MAYGYSSAHRVEISLIHASAPQGCDDTFGKRLMHPAWITLPQMTLSCHQVSNITYQYINA